jgi:hypothetical protein
MTYGSSVVQRLPIDLRVAANIMEDTNTFPTGQGIMRDAATRIEQLEEALKFYVANHLIPDEGPWGINSTDFGEVARAALALKENN